MALSDFSIIRKSLTSRMFSTCTTALTVAVAVALLLVLLSMGKAGREAFARGSGNMHLLISRDASSLVAVLNSVFYANSPRNYIDWPKFESLRDGFPFEWAIPTQLGDSYRGLAVMATSPDFFTKFKPHANEDWRLADGRYFKQSFEIVAGSEAAKLGLLSVGDKISLTHGAVGAAASADPGHVHREYEFEVVGILAPTGSAHDRALFCDLMSSWILHAHDRRLAEGGTDVTLTREADVLPSDWKITGIYARVFTRPGSDASAVMQSVFDQLRRDTSITVAHPPSEIGKLFQIVSNIDQIFLGMAAVVMVSSGIAIMLALYNSMEQRRRQIAVLRVLGCSRRRIFGLIMTESALLGLFGAAAGLVLSVIGAQVVALVLRERLGLAIRPVISPEWIVVICAATVLLASAAGIVPAVMAYRTSVMRNLRPIG